MERREFLAGIVPTVFMLQMNWRWILPKLAPAMPHTLRITGIGSTHIEITFE
jgi:hypothetical protein